MAYHSADQEQHDWSNGAGLRGVLGVGGKGTEPTGGGGEMDARRAANGTVAGHPTDRFPHVPDEDTVHEQHARMQTMWDQLVCRVERLRSPAASPSH